MLTPWGFGACIYMWQITPQANNIGYLNFLYRKFYGQNIGHSAIRITVPLEMVHQSQRLSTLQHLIPTYKHQVAQGDTQIDAMTYYFSWQPPESFQDKSDLMYQFFRTSQRKCDKHTSGYALFSFASDCIWEMEWSQESFRDALNHYHISGPNDADAQLRFMMTDDTTKTALLGDTPTVRFTLPIATKENEHGLDVEGLALGLEKRLESQYTRIGNNCAHSVLEILRFGAPQKEAAAALESARPVYGWVTTSELLYNQAARLEQYYRAQERPCLSQRPVIQFAARSTADSPPPTVPPTRHVSVLGAGRLVTS